MIQDKLTPREREAIAHQLEGHSYRQTAEAMQVTVGTVEQYLTRAYNKVGALGRSDLVLLDPESLK